jgi:hypothetical protein
VRMRGLGGLGGGVSGCSSNSNVGVGERREID